MEADDIIIVPFILPWTWSADYQKQTCLELAKKHKVMAYMENEAIFFLKALLKKRIRYPKYRNILFYRPLYMFPFRRIHAINKINQIVSFMLFRLFVVNLHKNILWIFDPHFYYLLSVTQTTSLYDCIDYTWSRNQIESDDIQRLENLMIQKVDYFFVNSQVLYAIHKSTRIPNAVVPQGFCLQDFEDSPLTHDRSFGNRPIIGYIGAINHRIDFNLILDLSKRCPTCQFVLCGYIQELDDTDLRMVKERVNTLRKVKNITIGQGVDRVDVPDIIRQFDIAIIPYAMKNDSVKYSYPMKLFEYFYLGKPVVSIPIEELKRFPKYVKIGESAKSWEKHITSLLSHPWPTAYKKEQKRLAEANSWEKKVNNILDYINS